jgi:serine/threonine protein kinase
MLEQKGHSFPVDWWTLGILTYEMVIGFPPFYVQDGSPSHQEMYNMIKNDDVDFIAAKYHQTPLKLSDDCKDFIL